MFLNKVFGMANCTHQKQFVKEVLFAPSSTTHVVPLLQDVIQADGAHSQFGKYTLLLAYGTNANCHMSPIAFGLLFRNEDNSNWSTFWTFVKTVHPSLDAPTKTILTDQDKGLIVAMKNSFYHAAQFMCSFHRQQNILKTCGGGKGLIPHSALWVFNILNSCNLVAQLDRYKQKYYEKMHPTNLHYLQKLLNKCQYPAARCTMGDGICMFSKSALLGVESMNRANQVACQRMAVDVLNGVILLLKLEAERFYRYKQLAWQREDVLTDKGMKLMEECFDSVNVRDYQMTVVFINNGHQAMVSKATVNLTRFTVVIPSAGHLGLRFGSCTCGQPATDGVPCKHMVVVVKSSSITGLSRIQIMPYW